MFLIAGLGNPGRQYERTRHNMGFDAIDELIERHRIPQGGIAHKAMYGKGIIEGEKVILAKPLTYMNLSGVAVKQLLKKYGAAPSQLVVMYDDFDIPKGHIRIRPSGSAGTHNGMRSVIAETGTQDFARIRIGIRDPEVNIPIINYVLSEVRKEDYELFIAACGKAAEAAVELAKGRPVDEVMTKFNG